MHGRYKVVNRSTIIILLITNKKQSCLLLSLCVSGMFLVFSEFSVFAVFLVFSEFLSD